MNEMCPRQDSNLRSRLRRAVLYPLSYEGRSDKIARQRRVDGAVPDRWIAGCMVVARLPSLCGHDYC